ncbi:unnamed protein product [Malus baccata var. baccata]
MNARMKNWEYFLLVRKIGGMPEIEVVANNVNGSGVAKINLFGNYKVERLLGCKAFTKVYHTRNVASRPSTSRRCSRVGSLWTMKGVVVELRCVVLCCMGLGGSWVE